MGINTDNCASVTLPWKIVEEPTPEKANFCREECCRLLGCDLHLQNNQHYRKYLLDFEEFIKNPWHDTSRKFVLFTWSLQYSFNAPLIKDMGDLPVDECRAGKHVEHALSKRFVGGEKAGCGHMLVRKVYQHIKRIFGKDVVIMGLCDTNNGPCADIVLRLRLYDREFLFVIEVKSTNHQDLSFLGNYQLTGPCSMLIVVGYDKRNYDEIVGFSMIPLITSNKNMRYAKEKKNGRYVHRFLGTWVRWIGRRPY
jgi:hypothetical protein